MPATLTDSVGQDLEHLEPSSEDGFDISQAASYCKLEFFEPSVPRLLGFGPMRAFGLIGVRLLKGLFSDVEVAFPRN